MKDSPKKIFIDSSIVFITLFLIAAVHWPLMDASLALVGCFGATTVLITITPQGKMAQPKAIFIGLLASSLIGTLCAIAFDDVALRMLIACAVSMAVMMIFDAQHPPSGAAALIMSYDFHGWSFLIMPVLTGTLLILIMRYLIILLRKKSLLFE